MPHKYWASGPDQLLAGDRYVILIADLEAPRPGELRDGLAAIAAAGKHTRLGLIPKHGTAIWSHNPDASLPVHELPDDVASAGSAVILEYIRRRPGARSPLEVHVSQRHIALDADHGLGDGSFTLDLISELFRGDHPSAWMIDTRLALPRALIRTFGRHPSRARMALKYASELRSTHTFRRSADSGDESVAWSPSFALSVAHIGPDAESAVNEWRRNNVGSAGTWLYIVRMALYAAGLQMTDMVAVAFNCRRYLPKNSTRNGNFMLGIRFPIADDERLTAVVARLRACTTSAVPLAGLGAVSALALLRIGLDRRTPSNGGIGAPANLAYTDMGHITSLDELPWRGDDERSYIGLLDPAGPDHITVLNSKIGRARNISISFHDNVFDRHVIDRAADYLKDPLRFLPSS